LNHNIKDLQQISKIFKKSTCFFYKTSWHFTSLSMLKKIIKLFTHNIKDLQQIGIFLQKIDLPNSNYGLLFIAFQQRDF